MKKIIAALLICICFTTNAMADHWHGPRYYSRPYYGYHHHDHFVAGVVTGAIIGGVLAPRPVYVEPQPVYTAPAYVYERQFDPYCNCWVTVRRVVDPYNQGY